MNICTARRVPCMLIEFPDWYWEEVFSLLLLHKELNHKPHTEQDSMHYMRGNQSIDRTNSNMPECLFDNSFKELIDHISCYFKFESTWHKRLGLSHLCWQILKVFPLKTKPSFVVKCIYIIPYLTEHVYANACFIWPMLKVQYPWREPPIYYWLSSNTCIDF